METIIVFAAVLVPVVTALVELAKQTAGIPSRFVPITALVIGVAIGYVSAPLIGDVELAVKLFSGGIAGLGSVGLFELGHQFNKEKTVQEDETKKN